MLYNTFRHITLLKFKLVNPSSVKHFNLLTCFRNERKCGPYNGRINKFSLDTKTLIQKSKEVELLLTFLTTEVKDTTILLVHYKAVCPGQGDLSRRVNKLTLKSSL